MEIKREFVQSKIPEFRGSLAPIRRFSEALGTIGQQAAQMELIPASNYLVLTGRDLAIHNPFTSETISYKIPRTVNNEENASVGTVISPEGKYVIAFRENGAGIVIDGTTGQKLDFELAPNSAGPIVMKRFKEESSSDEMLEDKVHRYCGIRYVDFSKHERYAIIMFKNSTARVFDFEKREYISKAYNIYQGKNFLIFKGNKVIYEQGIGPEEEVAILEPEMKQTGVETKERSQTRYFSLYPDTLASRGNHHQAYYVKNSQREVVANLADVSHAKFSGNRFVVGYLPGQDAYRMNGVSQIYDTKKGVFLDVTALGEKVSDIYFSENGKYAFYTTPFLEPDDKTGITTRFHPAVYELNVFDLESHQRIDIPQIQLSTPAIQARVRFVDDLKVLFVLRNDGDVIRLNLTSLEQDPEVQDFLGKTRSLSTELATVSRELISRGTIAPDRQEGAWYQFLIGQTGLAPDQILAAFRPTVIELRDGGNVVHSASLVSEAYLAHTGNLSFDARPKELAAKVPEKVSQIPFILKKEAELLFNHAESAEIYGRTIVLKINGETVALKLQRKGEHFSQLATEGQRMEYLQQLKTKEGLLSDYPSPLFDSGNFLRRIKLDYIPEAIRQRINGDLYVYAENKFTVSLPYRVPKGYFSYYTELDSKQAEVSTQKTIFDLFRLACLGLIHPDLITLFHNQIQQGREDAGKYVWNVDIVRPMQTRMGAGRLHAWERTVDYPNFGESGLRDFTELADFNNLYDPYLLNQHVRHLRTDLLRLPDHLKQKVALQYFLGNYMLAWTLAEGRRVKEQEGFDLSNPHPVAERVKSTYEIAYQAFTGREFVHQNLINWERLAAQMQCFMSGMYRASNIVNSSVPDNIYGLPSIKITPGDGWGYIDRGIIEEEMAKSGIEKPEEFLRRYFTQAHSDRRQIPDNLMVLRPEVKETVLMLGIFDDESNKAALLKKLFAKYHSGMRANGKDEDLGPMNGPLPLTELINANYLLTTLLIDNIS